VPSIETPGPAFSEESGIPEARDYLNKKGLSPINPSGEGQRDASQVRAARFDPPAILVAGRHKDQGALVGKNLKHVGNGTRKPAAVNFCFCGL
jgi:hypothetical protein